MRRSPGARAAVEDDSLVVRGPAPAAAAWAAASVAAKGPLAEMPGSNAMTGMARHGETA